MQTEKTFTDSKTISIIKYDTKTKVLTITYVTNKTYDYANVSSSMWEYMLKAESIGKFVNENIKGHYQYKLVN